LKNRAALRAAKRGLAIMKIARSVPPLDPKVVRRREAAAKVTASLPRAWLDEFQTEDELAVLQTIMEGVLANGSCEMSRRELAERAGVTPHIVQRTVSTAIAEGLVQITAWSKGVGATDRISRIEVLDPRWLERAKRLVEKE
jgi:hypothetical protein